MPITFITSFSYGICVPTFVMALVYFGINHVGTELSDPFGHDTNDIHLEAFLRQIDEDLGCYIIHWTVQPPVPKYEPPRIDYAFGTPMMHPQHAGGGSSCNGSFTLGSNGSCNGSFTNGSAPLLAAAGGASPAGRTRVVTKTKTKTKVAAGGAGSAERMISSKPGGAAPAPAHGKPAATPAAAAAHKSASSDGYGTGTERAEGTDGEGKHHHGASPSPSRNKTRTRTGGGGAGGEGHGHGHSSPGLAGTESEGDREGDELKPSELRRRPSLSKMQGMMDGPADEGVAGRPPDGDMSGDDSAVVLHGTFNTNNPLAV